MLRNASLGPDQDHAAAAVPPLVLSGGAEEVGIDLDREDFLRDQRHRRGLNRREGEVHAVDEVRRRTVVGERGIVDLTLPALTIGLYLAPLLVRTLRGSLIEVLATDYIEAARARGLSAARVVGRHALRNASMATVTVLGVNLGFLISGTVIVEVVFSIPGLGSLIVSQVQTRDFPTVQALTLIFGAIVIAINFLTDVVHVAVDPRIRTAR